MKLSFVTGLMRATLGYNVTAAAFRLYDHHWWIAATHALLVCAVLYFLLVRARAARLVRYAGLLIVRATAVTAMRMCVESEEEREHRFLALRLAIFRGQRGVWRKPWGAVEPAARDLELFGVPIAEHPLPNETVEWRIP